MRSIFIQQPVELDLDSELRSMRFGGYLGRIFQNLGLYLRARLYRRQIKTLDKIMLQLRGFAEVSLSMEYAQAARYLPQIILLKVKFARAAKIMAKGKPKAIAQIPAARDFYLKSEALQVLLGQIHEQLTYMEYLTHDAKFLLALPEDKRHKVMTFAMDRVRAAMELDPEGKAEYEAEVKAWMDFPFDPIVEH